MDILQTFYQNEPERESVKAFLEAHVRELAVKKALDRESTEHIADVMEVISNAFTELEEEYGNKVKVDTENKSR